MSPSRAKAREVEAQEKLAAGIEKIDAAQTRIEAKLDELLARPAAVPTITPAPKAK